MDPIGQVRQISKEASGIRAIVGRLFPKTDLLAGIRAICAEHHIQNGVVVSCIGSLDYARFAWVIPDPFARTGLKYREPTVIGGPLEFIAAQGTIGTLKDTGELSVHLHVVLTDARGVTWSGHVQEEGNPICATAEVAIQAFNGVELVRGLDAETELTLFTVS
ncbi:MAG: DNA-binding protein [Synergistaceae bacterium]|jgi:predicted DNA-binding protein with PD1-like motif|nr:DNA-binding protein [Synergistaceae bacterium]